MIMILLFNELTNQINNAKSILFVSHRNPDPDTVGSALALGGYAESLDKKTKYFCIDKIPENFSFIEGVNKFGDDKSILKENHDLIIFLDCSELKRSGIDNLEDFKKNNWISIDHHIERNEGVALSIRDSNAAATCEMIYNFLKYREFKIEGEAATGLLAGILIDTNFLSNRATKAENLGMAGELISCGADYRSIIKNFYLNKNQEILNIWGVALSRLKHNEKKNISTTAVFQSDIEKNENLNEALDGMSNFLNAIMQSDVIMVLKETKDGIKGSLRTHRDDINVAQIAEQYGGGGHRRAAGFICSGKLVEKEDEWIVEKL